MNNTSFAEILDGLEKDVLDIVSNLERQISIRLASDYRHNDRISPAKPFQPKWKGLRSALRWLWKGQSEDNPDYAHLYGKKPKREPREGRPTLEEYLLEVRTIDGFADEIFFEVFGDLIVEANISDLLRQFKLDFRNVIMKYKNLIKSAAKAPEEAPGATAQKPVAPEAPAPAQASRPTEPEKAPEVQTSEPATSPKKSEEEGKTSEPEKAPEEKAEAPKNEPVASSQEDEEKNSNSGVGSNEAGSSRKPKSHSANIGRWFKEAMDAKKKGGEGLIPKPEWLNAKGIVKPEKLPWVIAWMGTKSHKDLHKDEDVRSELQSAIGSSFKDFVPQIAKKKGDSLVAYLRKNMPMVSDEEFKRLVSELYGSEYDGPGASSQKKDKEDSKDASAEAEKEEKKQGPDIQEIRLKTLSVLYDGIDGKENVAKARQQVVAAEDKLAKATDDKRADIENELTKAREGVNQAAKEAILTSIENKIVEPVFDRMESDDDAEYFAKWWKSFKRERMRDDQETIDSLIVRINSGAMFDDILKNSEVSKKKPEKKIKLRNLMDMLKT